MEKKVNILGWLGDRTTAPSLLVQALYRCDHQAIQINTTIDLTNLQEQDNGPHY